VFILFAIFLSVLSCTTNIEAYSSPRVDYLLSIINNKTTNGEVRLAAQFKLASEYQNSDDLDSHIEKVIKIYESIMNDTAASINSKLAAKLRYASIIGNPQYKKSFKTDIPKSIQLIQEVIDHPIGDAYLKETGKLFLACFWGGFWGDKKISDRKEAIQIYEDLIKNSKMNDYPYLEHFYLAELLIDANPNSIFLTQSQLNNYDAFRIPELYQIGSLSDSIDTQNLCKLRLAQIYLWGKIRNQDRALMLCNEVIKSSKNFIHTNCAKSMVNLMLSKDNKKCIDIIFDIFSHDPDLQKTMMSALSKRDRKVLLQHKKIIQQRQSSQKTSAADSGIIDKTTFRNNFDDYKDDYKKEKEYEESLISLINNQKTSSDEKISAQFNLAEFYLMRMHFKSFNAAIRIFTDLIDNTKARKNIRNNTKLYLAKIYSGIYKEKINSYVDYNKAIKLYNEAIEDSGSDIMAKITTQYYLAGLYAGEFGTLPLLDISRAREILLQLVTHQGMERLEVYGRAQLMLAKIMSGAYNSRLAFPIHIEQSNFEEAIILFKSALGNLCMSEQERSEAHWHLLQLYLTGPENIYSHDKAIFHSQYLLGENSNLNPKDQWYIKNYMAKAIALKKNATSEEIQQAITTYHQFLSDSHTSEQEKADVLFQLNQLKKYLSMS